MTLRFGIGLLGCLLLVACGPGADGNDGGKEPTVPAEPGAQTSLPAVEKSDVASTTREEPPGVPHSSTPTESAVATRATVNDSDGTSIADRYADYEIVTLLPRDAIPAIDEPEFMDVAEADQFYTPEEFVMGVEFEGDARAYSVGLLSTHEIVNDTVGGVKIAVTW